MLSSRVAPIRRGRRKSYSVPATVAAPVGRPRSSACSTTSARATVQRHRVDGRRADGQVRMRAAAERARAGPTFVAVVRTVSPSLESEYSIASASANG